MKYAIYPFKKMGISQRHDQGNHTPHWKNSKDYSDKPFDECCGDSGQSVFAPKNDFKIIQIIGLNNNTTNTVIVQSTEKLTMPCGKTDYLYITLTHINEVDLKTLKVGTIIKAGTIIARLREGTDGLATGNHFHITANIGKYYGLKKNSNGKWCYVYEKSLLPTEAFYIDKNHTTIKNANGYYFKEVPKVVNDTFLPKRGFFQFGDNSANVGKIASFMRKTFPAYTPESALGNYYGKNLQKSIKTFQEKTGLEPDGCIGKKTLAMLVKYGFTY